MKQTSGSMWQKMQKTVLPALALLLLIAPTVHAHRVNVFAWVEGETVHTESRFPGGREVSGGQIVVYDDQTGEKLLEGETDDKGTYSFPVPRRADLRIELTAGMGHKNEWIVPAREISPDARASAPPPSDGEQTEAAAGRKAAVPAAENAADAARIEAAVEKVLDRKLAPVVKGMAELRQHRTSVSDVVGGIGYIVGLAGLGAYPPSRRKIKELERR